MRFRAPANVQLHRAQLILMLATLVPTVLMTGLGIAILALSSSSVGLIITGILVLTFCTTSITGYILGSIFVQRGASMARIQSDFLSSVSHELRTPLTSIGIFIETLRSERLTDPKDVQKCLDLLHQEVGRLQGLVTRLLELSRIETGKHQFERELVRIDHIVGDALAAFDAATLPTQCKVDVDLDPDLITTGDRATLAQALVNLLTNAWKYTPTDNKCIAIQARQRNKHIELIVADNGVGIPRAEQRQIFGKFERGKIAVEGRMGGVGLGLATVRAIVRAHRGKIELRSKPGEGAEFRILLRRRQLQTGLTPIPTPAEQPASDET